MPTAVSSPEIGGALDPNRDQQFLNNFDVSGNASFKGSATCYGATGGLGYSTGSGGSVTQITSKSTGVTLSTLSGQITMNNASLANATGVAFTVTNTLIAANDCPNVVILSGATANTYLVCIGAVAAGSFVVNLYNYSGSSQTDAIVLQFDIIRGAKI